MGGWGGGVYVFRLFYLEHLEMLWNIQYTKVGVTSDPEKIAELYAGHLSKTVTERKKERKEERQERKSDFLNLVSWSSERREEIESKGDIPPSLMTLFFNFFYPIFLLLQLDLACMKQSLYLVPDKNRSIIF